MKFHEMLGRPECPYQLNLGLEKRTRFEGSPPYPELIVLDNESVHVREIRWQVLTVRAQMPETRKTENVRIMRLVAVVEGGEEIEMQRMALPSDVVDSMPADPTKCAGCGGKIPVGAGVQGDDERYYHAGRCWG